MWPTLSTTTITTTFLWLARLASSIGRLRAVVNLSSIFCSSNSAPIKQPSSSVRAAVALWINTLITTYFLLERRLFWEIFRVVRLLQLYSPSSWRRKRPRVTRLLSRLRIIIWLSPNAIGRHIDICAAPPRDSLSHRPHPRLSGHFLLFSWDTYSWVFFKCRGMMSNK